MPDESSKVLHHGYAQAPQLDLEPGSQHVTFVSYGAAIRLWDDVIDYRRQRNNEALGAENPGSGSGTYCDLLKPAHFNPLRVGNMIPAAAPMETLDNGRDEYPIFTDDALWKYYKDADTKQPALWTLSGFVCYILAVHNDESDVSSPSFQSLVELLDARVPKSDLYDPSDPDTYDANPIIIPDFDVTGMRWPEALAKMLEMHGFAMQFQTYLKEDAGGPLIGNKLVIYRRDQAGPQGPKSVYLPPLGTGVDQQYANVGSVHLAWDLAAVRNAVSVEMAAEEGELSFILAPNFEPVDTDKVAIANSQTSGRNKFKKANLSEADDATRKKYRQFVAGDGNGRYWSYSQNKFVTGNPKTGDPLDFGDEYTPDPAKPPVYETPEKTNGFVPTAQTLVTKDDKDQPRNAILDIWLPTTAGTDKGRNPAVMGTFGTDSGLTNGEWVNIPDGWKLLEDRIGINITVEDPEMLSTDKASKNIHLISGSSPTNDIGIKGQPTFMLRLTTTVHLAERVPVNLGARAASPTKFPRWMLVDRQDQYKIQYVSEKDEDALSTADKVVYPRDDYQAAKDEAVTMRDRHEFPPLAGSITIPELSLAYVVSDRIKGIVGRNISLQCNAGTKDEKPTYPWVVSVTWNFTGPSQTTTLQLSDRRLDTVSIKSPVKPAGGGIVGFQRLNVGGLASGEKAPDMRRGEGGVAPGTPRFGQPGFGQRPEGAPPLEQPTPIGPRGNKLQEAGQGGFTPTPGHGLPEDQEPFKPTPGHGKPVDPAGGSPLVGGRTRAGRELPLGTGGRRAQPSGKFEPTQGHGLPVDASGEGGMGGDNTMGPYMPPTPPAGAGTPDDPIRTKTES